MQIDHTLTIHAPTDRVWSLVRQPEAVVESLPGVDLISLDGEDFTGTMSVGLGPMRLKYGGSGSLRYDESSRRIHIEARGNETRGAGSAAAVVDVSLAQGSSDSTRLDITIDLDLQGKPAQFGRGILSEVVTRLASQFGKNLERQITEGAPEAAPHPGTGSAPVASVAPMSQRLGSAPPPTACPGARQVIGIVAGAVLGAGVACVIASRRVPTVHLTVVGTTDPGWLELAHELSRHRR